MKVARVIRKILLLIVLVFSIYGMGRLYFVLTGGFTESNITSNLSYDKRWETHALSSDEQKSINRVLNQDYFYLGKGCQSYVFVSKDDHYVIKFIKYQRFRPQAWINLFTFIPSVKEYQLTKTREKAENLQKVFRSWKLAYEVLPDETGTVYTHLNKTEEKQTLVIFDKLGLKHTLKLNEMEYLVQKKATLLSSTIDKLMSENQIKKAEVLIDRLLSMILIENLKGYADNDHALMQNTGVYENRPIHIDVGQFVRNNVVTDPKVYHKELHDKTHQLRIWLKANYPDLAVYLDAKLIAVIGTDYYYMTPFKYRGNVGKIPYE